MPILDEEVRRSLQRMAAVQNEVLATAGAFDARLAPKDLPPELESAADALGLSKKVTRATTRNLGLAFGISMGVVAGIAFGLMTSDILAGVVFGAVAALLSGFPFALGMRAFSRYVVLPVASDKVSSWEKAITGIGYTQVDTDDKTRAFRPGIKNGAASGRIFVFTPSGDLAYLVGPAFNMSKVVKHHAV